MKEIFNTINDKLVAVDLDGTICHGEWWGGMGEAEPLPDTRMIEFLWDLYKKGAHIIIYTARQPRYYAITHAWLVRHEVPFHGIAMTMKPGADVYIDDKTLRPEEVVPDHGKTSNE